jgi:carbonic anhydrase/acetyltransferase-like protein (isoleucine patch superfamily)
VENNCVIGRDNFIGKGAVISAYCHLGKNVEIGDNVLLPTRTLLADNVILSQGEMWETFLTKEGVITSVCKDNCWLFWGAGKTGVTAKEFLEDDHIFLVQTWVKSFLTQGE